MLDGVCMEFKVNDHMCTYGDCKGLVCTNYNWQDKIIRCYFDHAVGTQKEDGYDANAMENWCYVHKHTGDLTFHGNLYCTMLK